LRTYRADWGDFVQRCRVAGRTPCLPRPGCFDLNDTRLDNDSMQGAFEAI